MKKTLLISTSLSSKSINFELLKFIKIFIPAEIENELVTIRDFELPLFNVDIEKEEAIAENAIKFMQLINKYDKLIFGIAEHNGSFTTGFKNILDWLSRLNKDYRFLLNKEILLIGTSPSPKGAIAAMQHAKSVIEMLGGSVKGQFPVPSYYSTFTATDQGLVINNKDLKEELVDTLNNFFSLQEESDNKDLVIV